MKYILPLAAAVVVALSSCSKSDGDPMILPQISFKTAAGYTYKDTTVAKGTILLTGISAAKSEPQDVLKRFIITRGFEADTVGSEVFKADLTGTQGDTYTYDYSIQTRSTIGKERYNYTVVNRDGLVNQVKLTVTTQ